MVQYSHSDYNPTEEGYYEVFVGECLKRNVVVHEGTVEWLCSRTATSVCFICNIFVTVCDGSGAV